MTNVVREHVIQLLSKDIRQDGRGLLEYRQPITIEYGISAKSAEGSARVRIGDTEVLAGVKMEVGEPYPDTPDEGTLIVGAELLPLSNPEFESGPPSIQAVELARVVDRGLRESHAVDFGKLCIKKGEKVWTLLLDIYPLNDAGNLFDAASLAALAALKDAKFPEYDEKANKLHYEKRTSKALPLSCLPIGVTVFKIKDKFFVDPTIEEGEAYDSRLTVATMNDQDICAMQKGGDGSLTEQDIMQMVAIATEKGKFLRTFFKK